MLGLPGTVETLLGISAKQCAGENIVSFFGEDTGLLLLGWSLSSGQESDKNCLCCFLNFARRFWNQTYETKLHIQRLHLPHGKASEHNYMAHNDVLCKQLLLVFSQKL